MRKLWIPLLLLGLILPRIYLILKFQSVLIDSDEAIVGLMARHILHGEFPLFYYGQNYMGTFEPLITAILFIPVGASQWALKLAPFLLFCVFLVIHYFLARSLADRQTAIFATMLVAISPSFLSIWSLKSRGGYVALLLFGTWSLWITIQILKHGYSVKRALLLGLTLGLAWWTHFLAIVYIVPIGIILLLKNEKQVLSRFGLLIVSGFLIGSLPFWIYNIGHAWASLRFAGSMQTDFSLDFQKFFATALPIFLGARHNWNREDFFPFGGPVLLGIYLIACLVFISRWWRRSAANSQDGNRLLLAFNLLFPLLFSASGYAWFVNEPRYLISLYSTVYILIVAAFSNKQIQAAVVVLLLIVNLSGTFRTRVEDFIGYTNVEPNDALISFLRQHQVKRAYAPYWVAYRLTFETGEEIICTPPPGDFVRYAPYLETVRSSPDAAFIRLNAPRYQGLHVEISPPKNFLANRVGNYDVFLPPARN